MVFDEFGYMESQLPAATEASGLLGVVLGIYLALMLPLLALSVASYVLQSLGLHGICKRRGIHHGWLSWLPVGNMWILGSISDQYQYVAKGKIRSRRKVLLGVMIATLVLGAPVEILALVAAGGAVLGEGLGLGLMLIAFLLMCAVSVVGTVFQYIACYDLFVSSDPNNATVFLVLSILFPVTLPFFIFACRKKDLGMPPRKAPEAPAPQKPVFPAEPVAEEEDFEEPARFVPEDE